MNKALLIVDPQYDFISGSLPVPGAQEAMDALARYISEQADKYVLKLVTVDWHPMRHQSFSNFGGEWPVHCVQHSRGAAVWQPILDAVSAASAAPGDAFILTKGTEHDKEEYSVFQNAASARLIASLFESCAISHVDVCGLAGDICVLSTFNDAVRLFPNISFTILQEFSPKLS